MALRRTLLVFGAAGSMCLVVLLPALIHHELRGPGTGWGDFPFFAQVLRGHILGTTVSNALALLFVLCCRKRTFEEKFLTVLALLTFVLALGIFTTGRPRIDEALAQLLKHRTLPYLALLSAIFAGAACSRLRDALLGVLPARIGRARLVVALASALLLVPLSVAPYRRAFALTSGARVVDSQFDNLEKRTYADAYEWLRTFTPRHAVVGFDDRFLEFGSPGYNQMASRIVLEAERYSLPGNQIEATRAHNEQVLKHLADWEPEMIHRLLVRYNVSYLLTWNRDAAVNLGRSSLFRSLHRNERVTVWEVADHDFVYASAPSVRFDDFRFGTERLWWKVTNPENDSTVLISVSFHPYRHALLGGSEIPIVETPDHLMGVTLSPGTHELELRFVRPVWYRLLEVASLLAWAVAVGLLAGPAWRQLAGLRRRIPTPR